MWPQIVMLKEAKLDEQEGLEWNWESGCCPWYFLVFFVGTLTPEDYPSPIFSTLGRKVGGTRE